ncbi:MAG: hypothetical protein HZA48_02840 [Planctomycetes bacterium]|nr:hypothetical protein [Planctomycetota bacterium]
MKKHVATTAAVLITIFMSASTLLIGDEAPMRTTSGQNLASLEKATEQIEMQSEEVFLILGKTSLKVKAVFHMKNTGTEISLKEGFPMGYYPDIMKDFQTISSGKKLDTSIINLSAGEIDHNKPVNDYWVTWENVYRENSTSTDEVSYRVEWTDWEKDGFYSTGGQSAGYILHTGSSWKGVIGKAVITLSFEDNLATQNIISISRPDAAVFQDGRVIWTFTDIEPAKSDDILIMFDPVKDYSALLQEYNKGPKQWKDTQTLAKRAMLHDRKLYWQLCKKLIDIGERKDGQILIPGDEMVQANDDVQWLIADEAISIFSNALNSAQEEPEAMAFLPAITDFMEILLNNKLFVDNTRKVYPSGVRGEKEAIHAVPNGGEYARKINESLRAKIKKAKELANKKQ